MSHARYTEEFKIKAVQQVVERGAIESLKLLLG
jgi:transposase-like protein